MLALYTICIAAATMAIACHWERYIRELSSDLTSVERDYNISYVIFFAVSTRVIISYRMSFTASLYASFQVPLCPECRAIAVVAHRGQNPVYINTVKFYPILFSFINHNARNMQTYIHLSYLNI